MGCGDACPVFPGKRYEDWTVADPAGQPIETVRDIRDDIQARVTTLLRELGTDQPDRPPSTEETRPMTTDRSRNRLVLFVCVHNAGRSQMAAAYLGTWPADRIEVLSAGSAPADQVNPVRSRRWPRKASTSPPRRPRS